MNKILIIKTGAAGDVVRTTTLLHIFNGEIDWIVDKKNSILLKGISGINNIIHTGEISDFKFPRYDLVVNLEDSEYFANFVREIKFSDLTGTYTTKSGKIKYTENIAEWFDMSLISRYGIEVANKLKYFNRRSYQEIIFNSFGEKFNGEPYMLPLAPDSTLRGDIAIAPKAGKVWPMKNWAYYNELADILRRKGLTVNFLPNRRTMLEHIGDISNHHLLISGDSLPMHIALGLGIKCVSIFICTSPYEIYDYGIQLKVISGNLREYFYRRDFVPEATKSVKLYEVLNAIYKIYGVTFNEAV